MIPRDGRNREGKVAIVFRIVLSEANRRTDKRKVLFFRYFLASKGFCKWCEINSAGLRRNLKHFYVTELVAQPFIEFIGKVLDFVVFTQGGESLKFVCTDFWVTKSALPWVSSQCWRCPSVIGSGFCISPPTLRSLWTRVKKIRLADSNSRWHFEKLCRLQQTLRSATMEFLTKRFFFSVSPWIERGEALVIFTKITQICWKEIKFICLFTESTFFPSQLLEWCEF